MEAGVCKKKIQILWQIKQLYYMHSLCIFSYLPGVHLTAYAEGQKLTGAQLPLLHSYLGFDILQKPRSV